MDSQLKFSIQLTEKDVAGAHDELWFPWRSLLLPGIVIATVGIGLLFVRLKWTYAAPTITAFGVSLIYLATFVPWISRWSIIRDFRRHPAVQAMMHYQMFEDRFTISSELSQSEVRWPAVLKAKETQNYLALYLSPRMACIIPLVYLNSSQTSLLRAVVKSHVKMPLKRKGLFFCTAKI